MCSSAFLGAKTVPLPCVFPLPFAAKTSAFALCGSPEAIDLFLDRERKRLARKELEEAVGHRPTPLCASAAFSLPFTA